MKMEVRLLRNASSLILILMVTAFCSTMVSSRQVESKAPTLMQKPLKEQIHLENTTVKLVCKVKGKPRPFLNWYRNGVLLDERENGRYTINRFALVIQNIQKTDEGNFSCRAQNQYGESWGNATIRVVTSRNSEVSEDPLKRNEGPPIFSPNKDVSYYVSRPAAQDILLDCDARGYPYPTITWLKDGVKLDTEDEDSNYEVDGFKLKVNNLVLKDAGNYTCIVENRYGHIAWSTTVNVLQRMPLAPMIEGPMNQTVIEGMDTTFECKIVNSDTTPQLQWLRHYMVNGSYTNEDGEPYVRVLQQSGFLQNIGDPQILVVRNVTQEDVGWYTCLVANTIGINYVSAWLTVIREDTEDSEEQLKGNEGPPTFNPKRHIAHVVEGLPTGDIRLDCRARGFPYPTITWLKDGVKLDPKDQDSNYEFDGLTLKVHTLGQKNAGNYKCIVENKFGRIMWSFAVKVQQRLPLAPMIEGPMNQTVIEGKDARFECKVLMSESTPLLQWLRHYTVNGSYPKEEGEPYVKVLQQSGFHQNTEDPQILVIRNVTQEDAGWYTCLVANAVGINYVSAWLTVIREDTQRLPLAPMIEGPMNQTVTVGKDARFECKVLKSDSTPLLQWLRHYTVNGSNSNQKDEPNVKVLQLSGFSQSTEDPQILVIRNVTQDDAGRYTCLVASSDIINYFSAWLTVIREDTPHVRKMTLI